MDATGTIALTRIREQESDILSFTPQTEDWLQNRHWGDVSRRNMSAKVENSDETRSSYCVFSLILQHQPIKTLLCAYAFSTFRSPSWL